MDRWQDSFNLSISMGSSAFVFLLLAFLPANFAQNVTDVRLIVDGAKLVAEIDDNFICATIDWWPHDKCNYNQCPWGYSSVLNMNLSRPLLAKAVQAFGNLRIRIGGSLQDQVIYDVGNLDATCHPFQKNKGGLFGFTKGCLHMSRWDEVNSFLKKTGAIVTFGLNALHGRHQIKQGVWGGDWNSSNARDFMNYTISKGYDIDSWEFGNELSGNGVAARVGAEQYGKDMINLKTIVRELYESSPTKPSVAAPGGFFDQAWYAKLLQVSGESVVNVMTHHIYNLGAGVDPNLVSKILDPHHLSKIRETFSSLAQTIQKNGPWASAWVGESGGAYNSGGRLVSDRFVNSFWYLDQLGMSSKYNTKVYCRQTLVGGNYGLLNKTTLLPNPDYYNALLWHRLMGKGVLSIGTNASPFLRSYAHCSKGRTGITLLLINLSKQTKFKIIVENSMNMNLHVKARTGQQGSSFVNGLKRTVSWVGTKASDLDLYREEYYLTPKEGYIQSNTMLLNGIPLELESGGEIPAMNPVLRDLKSPISINPLSIAFISFPNFDAAACA